MKYTQIALQIFVALLTFCSATAEPVMTNGTIAQLDVDGNQSVEIVYEVGARNLGEAPQQWKTGFSLTPWGQTRIVRQDAQQIGFSLGSTIDASKPVYKVLVPNPPQGTTEFYVLTILNTEAISYDGGQTWEYRTVKVGFEQESEVLLGLKLALPTGTHYGWIKLTRPTVDLYTPFTVVAYAYHPVPGQPIGAGEAPPPPPLQWSAGNDGSLNFTWDTALGEAVLEWTDSLDQPNWQPVPDASAPPLVLLPGEGQRFYRLRRP